MTERDTIDPALRPSTEPRPEPVRKISALPLMALGALALLAGSVMYAAAKHSTKGHNDNRKHRVRSSRVGVAALTRGREAGIIPAAKAAKPAPALRQNATTGQQEPADGGLPPSAPLELPIADETGHGIPTLPEGFDAPPPDLTNGPAAPVHGTPDLLPPGSANAQTGRQQRSENKEPSRADKLAERVAQHRIARFFAALEAPLTPASWKATSAATPVPTNDAQAKIAAIRAELASMEHAGTTASSSYAEKLQQLQALLPSGNGLPGAGAAADPYDRFAGDPGRWALGNELENPGSLFELRAGSIIPAVLNSFINSDLPGPVRATVSIDVRDTATGDHVLIPQGSRLVGAYTSGVAFGQDGLLVAWQRIIFPDGRAIDLGAMPGADGSGQIGLRDMVDHHYLRIFGSALLLSGITGGIAVSQDAMADDNNRVTLGGTMAQSLGNQLARLSEANIRKNMEHAPTVKVRPGKVLSVEVIKDLTFDRPYRPFDYLLAITAEGSRYVAQR